MLQYYIDKYPNKRETLPAIDTALFQPRLPHIEWTADRRMKGQGMCMPCDIAPRDWQEDGHALAASSATGPHVHSQHSLVLVLCARGAIHRCKATKLHIQGLQHIAAHLCEQLLRVSVFLGAEDCKPLKTDTLCWPTSELDHACASYVCSALRLCTEDIEHSQRHGTSQLQTSCILFDIRWDSRAAVLLKAWRMGRAHTFCSPTASLVANRARRVAEASCSGNLRISPPFALCAAARARAVAAAASSLSFARVAAMFAACAMRRMSASCH
jgi:hypothetical protein